VSVSSKRARILAIAAFIAAAAPAAFVYFAIQPVPTMLYPLIVGALPLLARSAHAMRILALTASALMFVLVVLGALSVGHLFIPSLLLLLLTGLAAREPADTP
jgi:hypothetical protein